MSIPRIPRKEAERPASRPGVLGTIDIPGELRAIAAARAYVRGLPGVAGRPDVDQVELLVSELVANSMQYSDSGSRPCGMVRLVVRGDSHVLRVEVSDEGSAGTIPAVPAQVDPLSESGRGLWLVRELSSSWGWHERAAGGRVVWFEMAEDPG
ncbi:ATP-binding protein [Sphaerisporangium corydalis]|uniref:ATP-binding protein n=1 Tax=Sphaerisporangium corydalis TaxID=1441875 RepID=A0ABV9E9K5_9ACTN|nr:ATP-binding protein [Sphaerisporangium corydalis]